MQVGNLGEDIPTFFTVGSYKGRLQLRAAMQRCHTLLTFWNTHRWTTEMLGWNVRSVVQLYSKNN